MKAVCMTAVAAPLLASCINEDLSGCGVNYEINYRVRLDTDVRAVLAEQLPNVEERTIRQRLEESLDGVFSNVVHDVDLMFYSGNRLAHSETHRIDAAHSEFTVYLSPQDYRHLVTGNLAEEPVVAGHGTESRDALAMRQTVADTIASHSHALFAARKDMAVRDVSEVFDVDLTMQNSTAVLVADHNGYHPEEIFAYVEGFATGYAVDDSTYSYESPAVMRTVKVSAEGYDAFHATGFPSKDAAARADGGLWNINVYVKLNGKYTETKLAVKEPLKAAQLRLIKVYVKENGSVATDDRNVGVSVQLDWKPGGNHDVEI